MKPNKRPTKKGKPAAKRRNPVHIVRAAIWKLFEEAEKGDVTAARALLTAAHDSTLRMEELFHKNKGLVQRLADGAYEFPILWSWSRSKNTKRQGMTSDLKLGSTLPLKTNRASDEFYRRLQEELFWTIGLDPSPARLPIPKTKRDCRVWARAIVDSKYPAPENTRMPLSTLKPQPSDEDIEDAKPEHYKRRRRAKAEKGGTGAADWCAEYSKEYTVGEFRSGLIDSITSRLWMGLDERTEKILGQFQARRAALKRDNEKPINPEKSPNPSG